MQLCCNNILFSFEVSTLIGDETNQDEVCFVNAFNVFTASGRGIAGRDLSDDHSLARKDNWNRVSFTRITVISIACQPVLYTNGHPTNFVDEDQSRIGEDVDIRKLKLCKSSVSRKIVSTTDLRNCRHSIDLFLALSTTHQSLHSLQHVFWLPFESLARR